MTFYANEETLTTEEIQQMRIYLNAREFKRLLSMYYPVGDVWKRLPMKNELLPMEKSIPRIPRLMPFRLPKLTPRFI